MTDQELEQESAVESRRKKNIKRYEKWGYLVCVGTVLTFVAAIAHLNSFGLLYNDFIEETKSTSKAITTAHGVFAMALAMGGFILTGLNKLYSLKNGGILGSIMFISGSILNIFTTNTNQLIFTFGILQGLGFGIMVPVCYTVINSYYVKRRTTALSICKSIQGTAQMFYPQVIELFLSEYGLRGTLLIISGISLHTLVGMLLMIPKKDLKKSNFSSGKNKVIPENLELMNHANEHVAMNATQENHESVTKFKSIIGCINLNLVKNFSYCNICIGQAFVNFSDITFFILQPLLLFQNDYNKSEVAACISIGAGADLAGRCFMVLLSSCLNFKTRTLYFFSAALTMVGRIVFLQIRQFSLVAMATAYLGFVRACLHITSPLVIADQVTSKDFPSAYSLYLLFAGIVNLVCNPLIGVLKDVYSDYTCAFYGLAACCAPCVLLWPAEYLLTRRRHDTSTQHN